jgi:hypothetical protein
MQAVSTAAVITVPSLYGRGVAETKMGNTDAGNADVVAAEAIQADVGTSWPRSG